VRADEAESHMRTHRLMLSDLQADFETEKKRSFDIIADMTRQYKALREDFARQTQRLTNEISTYKDKLGTLLFFRRPPTLSLSLSLSPCHSNPFVFSLARTLSLSLFSFPADAQRAYAELERIKDSDLALKDVEIAEHKRRMDRMGEDFTLMLQDTLNKMSEKITITTHWNLDQDNPVVRTFEDHALVDSKLRARADAVGQHQQGAGKRP
jgi:hypothetical protein